MTQTVAEILNGAADYLETYGWGQGALFFGDTITPSCCAAGAIVAAEHPSILSTLTRLWKGYEALERSAAAATLAASLPDVGCDDDWAGTIAIWNDKRGRTVGDVVAKLREVAAASA